MTKFVLNLAIKTLLGFVQIFLSGAYDVFYDVVAHFDAELMAIQKRTKELKAEGFILMTRMFKLETKK